MFLKMKREVSAIFIKIHNYNILSFKLRRCENSLADLCSSVLRPKKFGAAQNILGPVEGRGINVIKLWGFFQPQLLKEPLTPNPNAKEIGMWQFIFLNGVGQILQMNARAIWVPKDFVLFRCHLRWNIFKVISRNMRASGKLLLSHTSDVIIHFIISLTHCC